MYTAIAVACSSAATVTVAWLLTVTQRRHARAAGRREELLVNQILNLAGRPWLPPPADTPDDTADPARSPTASPEQLP